jgi:hypothetical protein
VVTGRLRAVNCTDYLWLPTAPVGPRAGQRGGVPGQHQACARHDVRGGRGQHGPRAGARPTPPRAAADPQEVLRCSRLADGTSCKPAVYCMLCSPISAYIILLTGSSAHATQPCPSTPRPTSLQTSSLNHPSNQPLSINLIVHSALH